MDRAVKGFLLLCLLLTISTPVYANVGVYRHEFKTAVKEKRVALKKTKVGKTVLYYDSKIPKKRIKTIKKLILHLPSKVQRSAKRVYFLKKKSFDLTMRPDLPKNTLGYAILDGYQEIYLYDRKNTDSIRFTLWHEFGHTYDSREKTYGISSSKEWKKIVKSYLGGGDPHEWYADIFSEFFAYFVDPDYNYIRKTLKWT